MKNLSIALVLFIICVAAPVATFALDRTSFDELVALRDSATVKEVMVFAPDLWQKGERKFADAERSIQLQKKQKTIEEYVAQAREYTENALRASEIAKNTLRDYLPPRDKAREAEAYILVPGLYMEAENQFVKATKRVESGSVKDGLKEAGKAVPLFDKAELEALKASVMNQADALIGKAITDDALKYALATLDKARSARVSADEVLTKDRYNREEATVEATRAEYEAKHASNISQSVRALERNDQAWEKLMLGYEIQMDRVGQAIGLAHLPFDNGPLAAADTLIAYIGSLESAKQAATSEMGSLSADVTAQLTGSLKRLGVTGSESDPVKLAEKLDTHLAELLIERDQLAVELQENETQLADLNREHQEMSGELSERVAREDKFRSAKTKLNPSEGEVLFNSSNDIVLRLSGLSFDVGKSDIKDNHIPLLEKVKEVIQMFPEARLMVEGHTDASGDPAANITLSERRAYAVLQYLRQSLLIPADKINAMGFGADRPVASNQTADGRAKNRRIDVIIME